MLLTVARFWGEKQKLDSREAAGETGGVKLCTLVSMQLFERGDVWKYTRSFVKGLDSKINVLKEFILSDYSSDPVAGTCLLSFNIPKGDGAYIKADTEYATVRGINTLACLETTLLDADGRVEKISRPNGNAWKCLRIFRKGHDIGSLFELREKAYKIRG